MNEVFEGKLYIVATPIGNLADITLRSLEVLRQVDLIAAEDTRHCRRLLSHHGIDTPVTALHEHNETEKLASLITRLQQGSNIALVSDAGTPLINDPGFPLVNAAHQSGITVSPIPGPCAITAALSAGGISANRFAFEGFPPRTPKARKRFFEALLTEPRTIIFYESSHRLEKCLEDIQKVFPSQRRLVIAKEITKIHERFIHTTADSAPEIFHQNPELKKGEFVLLLEGAPPSTSEGILAEHLRTLHLLLEECPLKTAVTLAEKITGVRKKTLYQAALDWQKIHKKNS